MKKKILVIGLGRFGLNIVKCLTNMNADLLAIDIDQERVEMASEFTQYCEICDTTKLDVLEEIDASSFETAIVAIGSLQSTFLTVANLSEMGVKRIYVRLESSEYENVIRKLGATDIIIPEISEKRLVLIFVFSEEQFLTREKVSARHDQEITSVFLRGAHRTARDRTAVRVPDITYEKCDILPCHDALCPSSFARES
jgi:threonine dehydrogenase-like Zn-dependent dehydrogenase